MSERKFVKKIQPPEWLSCNNNCTLRQRRTNALRVCKFNPMHMSLQCCMRYVWPMQGQTRWLITADKSLENCVHNCTLYYFLRINRRLTDLLWCLNYHTTSESLHKAGLMSALNLNCNPFLFHNPTLLKVLIKKIKGKAWFYPLLHKMNCYIQ